MAAAGASCCADLVEPSSRPGMAMAARPTTTGGHMCSFGSRPLAHLLACPFHPVASRPQPPPPPTPGPAANPWPASGHACVCYAACHGETRPAPHPTYPPSSVRLVSAMFVAATTWGRGREGMEGAGIRVMAGPPRGDSVGFNVQRAPGALGYGAGTEVPAAPLSPVPAAGGVHASEHLERAGAAWQPAAAAAWWC